MDQTRRWGLFSVVIPSLALLVSASLVAFPAAGAYEHLKHEPRTSSASATGGERRIIIGQFEIPERKLGRTVVEMTAVQQQGPIHILNAPGYLVYALIALGTGHNARSFPESIGPFLWRVIAIPFCAIPAWWLVGRGMDGFFRKLRLRRADLVASILSLLISVAISVGLRFGLTDSERTDDDMVWWYITGFGWWTLLFAIPLAVSLFQSGLIPVFPHRTEYDFRIQEGAGRCRGASTPKRR